MSSYNKIILSTLLFFAVGVSAQESAWKIAGGKIVTQWAENVNPGAPLPEYPRPQMERKNNWVNLNGLWEYAIVPKVAQGRPAVFDGQILVPYPVESALSGVAKSVGEDSVLWYKRSINISSALRKGKILLHFGAVDWQSDIYVNGKLVGSHAGGYDPFYFDISSALQKGVTQEIAVRVWDPTNNGPQPRGKQVRRPGGIWYTPVTGIWQTVWMEVVPRDYVSSIRHTPDIDRKTLNVSAVIENAQAGDQLQFSAWDGSTKVAEQVVDAGTNAVLKIPNAKLWSLSNPFLYDLNVRLIRRSKIVDEVKGYFGMRKISMGPDENGILRMRLNNEFVFQYGPLDQGWWPDGLYTAPTDDALKFDIERTKEIGFNMIRKHVKVEPARWYYHCDKIGVLVWQDMPSGDLGNRWDARPGVVGIGTDKKRTPESESIFRSEWKQIMTSLHNFPSIVVWVPFNEAWGQFKTDEIVEWTMKSDPSRLVNSASGGNFNSYGHIIDLHNYPDPAMPDPKVFGKKQALVLGEFGGLGLPLEGHTWQQRNWGYQSFGTRDSLFMRYEGLMTALQKLIAPGLSAAVYTQTTDVEGETNGFFTYDRKVLKMPLTRLQQLHKKLYQNVP